MTFKPDNLNTLTPYFLIEGAMDFITFLGKAFDAEVTMMHQDEKGRVRHAEVDVQGTVIEIGEPQGNPEWPSTRMAMHLFTPDVDAVYAQALTAGATSIHEVMTMDYGERSGAVRDHWGNDWYIATVVDPMLRSK